MNGKTSLLISKPVSAGCHINDVMNIDVREKDNQSVSAGCHINDVMN